MFVAVNAGAATAAALNSKHPCWENNATIQQEMQKVFFFLSQS